MIVERPYRIAGAAGAVAAMALVAAHARACTARAPATATPAVPPVSVASVAAVPPAAPRPSPANPPAKADGGAAIAVAIPTRTVPCVDDRMQLVADGGRALLCWGERCLGDLDDPASTLPRRAPPAAAPETVVSADRVCSGARCDRLGPRLRAAVADAAGSQLSATRDHAAVVIHDGAQSFEVWNRAADRRVDLGQPTDEEGDVVSVDVIGNSLIVARACNEFCSSIARIVDARGRRHGRRFGSTPHWGSEDSNLIALDAEHFVVFGFFGEITLIAGDRVIGSAALLADHARQPHQATAQVVRLDERTLVAAWCSGFAPERGCHVTRISVDVGSDGGRPDISLDGDRLLPLCRSVP